MHHRVDVTGIAVINKPVRFGPINHLLMLESVMETNTVADASLSESQALLCFSSMQLLVQLIAEHSKNHQLIVVQTWQPSIDLLTR